MTVQNIDSEVLSKHLRDIATILHLTQLTLPSLVGDHFTTHQDTAQGILYHCMKCIQASSRLDICCEVCPLVSCKFCLHGDDKNSILLACTFSKLRSILPCLCLRSKIVKFSYLLLLAHNLNSLIYRENQLKLLFTTENEKIALFLQKSR